MCKIRKLMIYGSKRESELANILRFSLVRADKTSGDCLHRSELHSLWVHAQQIAMISSVDDYFAAVLPRVTCVEIGE